MADVNGVLFFSASTNARGWEPWVHLPSLGETFLLQDIAAGPASSRPRTFTHSARGAFFLADDGATGPEPWILPGEISPEASNAKPEILGMELDPDPVQVGSQVVLAASFHDGD